MKTRNLFINTVIIALLLFWQLPANAQDLLATYALALQNDPVLKEFEANRLAVGESKDQSIAQM
jgi:outer membrane protein